MKIRSRLLTLIIIICFACSENAPDANIPVTSVTLMPASLSLTVGETSQLVAEVSPAEATNKSVMWSSSNDAAATVDTNGMVTAMAAGSATITATSVDGNHSATSAITVTGANQITHRGATWNLFNSQVYTIKTNDASVLQLDLAQNAIWYNSGQGGLIYRTITGDFTFTATVSAVKKSNNSAAPDCEVCLGGLMVRDPASSTSNENYVHLVTGFTPGGIGAETKNTTGSNSQFAPTAPGQLPFTDGHAQHDLRIIRSGNTFTLSKKSPNDPDWVLLSTYDRPNFPSALMVGVNIYTSITGPTIADLSVIYQNITISQ